MANALPEKWALPMRMGWSVIPLLARGKRPAIPTWTEYQQYAADRTIVQRWAAREYNLGIVTGKFSGLLVLDLDSSAAVAEAERRGLPSTVKVATAKGLHCYFKHPGGTVKNRTGIFPGADIRCDGGFVVAPGSIHPSGKYYIWLASPSDTALSDVPPWLSDLLAQRQSDLAGQSAPKAPRERWQNLTAECTPYGRAALERESETIRRAANGEQENTLNSAALKIGALVGGGELSLGYARSVLIRAGLCMANHDVRYMWTINAITRKVDRALADGAASPRSAPISTEASHG